jgi:catechol 2,3-dioxygenase-like lactoylglutathione lyase family enzyme
MHDEPIMDVAHLGHLELLTPKPEESLRFFVDVMGMTESGQKGASVYLRAWDDYERYSLQLTASSAPGLGHAAFRTRSPQALDRRVQEIPCEKMLRQARIVVGEDSDRAGRAFGGRRPLHCVSRRHALQISFLDARYR